MLDNNCAKNEKILRDQKLFKLVTSYLETKSS